MVSPTTQSLLDDLKQLTTEFHKFVQDSLEFQATVKVKLAVIQWVGVFFSGVIISLVGATIAFTWNASALYSEVGRQEFALERIDKNHGVVLAKLETILSNIKSIIKL